MNSLLYLAGCFYVKKINIRIKTNPYRMERVQLLNRRSFFTQNKQEANQGFLDFASHFVARHRYLVYKRGMDIVTALLITVLIFPWLFPILMLMIRLDSRGPIFFKQKKEWVSWERPFCAISSGPMVQNDTRRYLSGH